jgi:NADPH:quinone reductase-like Zn-dependent oxidoreductase
MRVVRLRAQGHPENLKLVEEDPANPRPGELLVRIRAASLNFHDDLVVHGQVKPGDAVLILGTSAVSLFALQFAKAAGARVIATSSSEEKLEKLARLGADAVINYKTVPDWGKKAKGLTDGRGVDHVIEVGGPGTLMQSITACRTGGHIALIGVLTGFAGEVSIPALFSNQIRISGISVGSRADQEDSICCLAANFSSIVPRAYPFSEEKRSNHLGGIVGLGVGSGST